MHTRIVMLAALLATGSTQAAEEFGETIPTEIAKIFMGLELVDGNLYTDIPADFPAFVLPQEITVIGSINRREGNQSVYLRSNLDPVQSRDALQQALAANGWRVLESPGMRNSPQTGFMTDGFMRIPSMLCHDEQGNLSLTSQRSSQDTVIIISRVNAMNPGQSCSSMAAEREQQIRNRGFLIGGPLAAELPRLELPREGSIGRPSGSTGGISGGSDEVRTGTPMQIAWQLSAVLEHFAAQVDAQGWMLQDKWDTAAAAGGTWMRTTQAGASLLGILSVIRKAEGDYLLEFRIISTPSNGGCRDTTEVPANGVGIVCTPGRA